MKLVSLGRILGSVLVMLPVLLVRHGTARGELSKRARPDLTGIVRARGGSPLGDATVLIYTAGPRMGPGIFCPSCYLDCGKRARTGADGKFKIESLDPDLLFQILVVETSYMAAVQAKIDPNSGPVEVTLDPRETSSLGPKNLLSGRVVDPEGKPIPGAVVSFEMFFGDEANCAGRCDGIDPMAVTDDSGEFLLASKKPFDWMTVTVEAPGGDFFNCPVQGRTS